MRKLNAFLSLLLIILLIIHAVAGSLSLFGASGKTSFVLKFLSWFMVFILCIHFIISLKLTIDEINSQIKSGVSYVFLNKLFWIRRLSGFLILIFAICHIFLFAIKKTGEVRLKYFGKIQLTFSILFVLSLFVHIASNIKPLILSLGAVSFWDFIKDIILIILFLSIFAAGAFIVYYLRWNTF